MMARISSFGELFSCSEEHDYTLIGEINSRVGVTDELIIAGDFSLHKPGKFRAQIKCRNVRLVLGNHDQPLKCSNVFGNSPSQMTTKVFSGNKKDYLKAWVTHYPTTYWDGSHRGWCHLYGHVHGQREEQLDRLFPGRRAMDIGVDNIFKLYGHWGPISEVEVYDYMSARPGHDHIPYYTDYQSGLYAERGLSHLNPFDKSE